MSAGGSAPTNGGLCLLNERNDLHVADTTCPSLALTAGGALWLSLVHPCHR